MLYSCRFLPFYADDTNAFLSGNDIDALIDTMNEELKKLVVWLQVNKLKLNVKKTHFMIFSSNKHKYDYTKKLFLLNTEIKMEKFTKFLGVIIDQNLNWKQQILHVKKKVSRGLGIIRKARKYLNYDALRTLYHSFVYPYLDYCIEVFGSAKSSIIEPLCRMQRKAIRLITSSHYRADTVPLFEKCKILTLAEIHVYKTALFMFRVHHNYAPVPFKHMFVKKSQIHNYNTRSKSNLDVPAFRLDTMKLSIRVKGVYIWNFVYDNVNAYCDLDTFKFSLRNFLLNNVAVLDIIP